MIKVEVLESFRLGRFNELHNLVRKSGDENGLLFTGDVFECEEGLARYLLNEDKNPENRAFVKVLEIIPEKEEPKEEIKEEVKEEKKEEKKPVKKTTKKTTKRK